MTTCMSAGTITLTSPMIALALRARLVGRELCLAEVDDHSAHHREGAVVLGHRPDALALALAHDRDGRVVPDGGHR